MDPRVVEAWIDAGAEEVGLAVLLRTPGLRATQTLEDERLADFIGSCTRARLSMLLGCAARELDELSSARALAGLTGIQLRGDPQSRPPLPRGMLVGRSVHAPPVGPAFDYAVFGPVFEPGTVQAGARKKAKGMASLSECLRASSEPVLALGGITAANAAQGLKAGAWGLAGISALFGPIPRVVETVGALVALLRDAPTP